MKAPRRLREILDSNRFRRPAKQGLRSTIFRSKAFQELNVARRYIVTYYKCRTSPNLFQDVKIFCVLVGHTKSGGSMIGALLDAHPNMIFSDEVDALRYVQAGFSRDQIYHLLLEGSRTELMKGRITARRLDPYTFLVPSQWQGRFRKLEVMGDTKAGLSTRRFAEDPNLFERLNNLMAGVNVKQIHLIRNPYDPISVMVVRGKRSFENAIERYFANCEMLKKIRKQMNDSLIAMRYEAFVRYPEVNLEKICHFLGQETDQEYLAACRSILYESPEKSRNMVQWDSKWIEVVRRRIEQYDFLDGYTYEN